MRRHASRTALSLLALATTAWPGAAPCGPVAPGPAGRTTEPSTAGGCEGLVRLSRSPALPNPTTVIGTARLSPAGPRPAGTSGTPEHCEVLGKMNERVGTDGRPYSIQFHLRLPSSWNGRLFFQGGGATNGHAGDALGNLQGRQPQNALERGYAVVSQDSGHDNAVAADPSRGGTLAFGFDPQARLDFGYRSYQEVTRTAKAIIRAYYGRGAERSYYVGCSEGGREALMVTQRFPGEFDGVLAVAPGLRLPTASVVGESWDLQSFAAVARAAGLVDRTGLPLLNKAFTDRDLSLVSSAVLAACDGLDGVEDGIIDNFPACGSPAVRPTLAALSCQGAKTEACLTTAQIGALHRVFDGARDSEGRPLYADWPWDAGIGDSVAHSTFEGWRRWKLGTFGSEVNDAINATMGATAAATLFTTPPVIAEPDGSGFLRHALDLDLGRGASTIRATSAPYDESARDFMMASSTDIARFTGRGGKVVIVHGVSDPVFSINDTIAWWRDLDEAMDGKAAAAVRLFAVPGMAHCGTGPATDQFDAFTALVGWVEAGRPPDRILATARETTPWPNRTRPLCPYPAQARYRGEGSVEEATSFECR